MHVVWKSSQGSRCDAFIEALTKDQSLKLQIGAEGAQHLPGDSQHHGRPQRKCGVSGAALCNMTQIQKVF